MSLLSRLAISAARAYGILSSKSTNVSADYLVVAGGGSGGGLGGGGAGGLLTSTATLSTLNTYSITVGAGGAPFTGQKGNNGSNSSISGTGLSTVTSTGGGGGGGFDSPNQNGNSGGSGGGGGCGANGPLGTGGAGTSGQGFAGGNPVSASPTTGNGAGGGGAGAVGSNSPASTTGGNGGAGSSSSISGSSVTYAGGGGGGAYILSGTGTAGTGGSGGGGNGGRNGLNPTAGTVNTGGGGGGSGLTSAGALNTAVAGGSGIVIISYTSATPKFVGGTITTSGGKQIHTFTSSGTLSPITPITASYLVVAGGGGGGQGGGGAGGLLTSSTTIYSGATYVVTVGGGGAALTNGSDSSFSGTGLTTLTAIGGGKGGTGGSVNGSSGGSGGGGQYGGTGGAGTSGQGFAGGAGGGASVNYPSGGGGGAGAVGQTPASSSANGGNGGIGVQSSISGTATYYAGGGGGGSDGTAGTGGNGGGANGTVNTTPAGATPNTGGGGGGRNNTTPAGAGGSGIVIISYAGSQAFNGGLVTTSGGNTIHTFTSTGALTPLTNNLNNSLRFRRSNNAYLSRTPTVAGNQKTWTYSAWVKRGLLGSIQDIWHANGPSTTENDYFAFDSDTLQFRIKNSNVVVCELITTQVFRDPSAWYHIVAVWDSTQATAANRVKLYVNGNQITAFSTATYPSQNTETSSYNNTVLHTIGTQWYNSTLSNYLDGYMTDINFIDGQALEPYYFGNNDANGVWKPIQYKGTYGTNGFYLTFGNTTSTTTLGYDSSPNGNNWTCNNISLTAGVTYDAMTDVPTNTSATVANYCTLNPLDKGTSGTLDRANLQWSSGASWQSARGTMTIPSGKFYFEGIITSTTSGSIGVNFGLATAANPLNVGGNSNTASYSVDATSSSNVLTAGSQSGSGSVFTAGDVLQYAIDRDNNRAWFGRNNTWYNSTLAATGDPVAGTNATWSSLPADLFPFINTYSQTVNFNFGQRPFSYTPPTGYVALNTFNLPTPTILQGNKYMDATLWTGNGSLSRTITNAAGFKPDLIWNKDRTTAYSHRIVDSVRGVRKELYSNTTEQELDQWSTYGSVNSFDSNGFTLTTGGTAGNFISNLNGDAQVAWQWQAGQGSTSSNTSGSITSTVSVNTTAGFSIVTYTGNGSSPVTIGHGLGVAPKFIIIKDRSVVSSWVVQHTSLGWTQGFLGITTAAASTSTLFSNNTAPTSSVFTVGGYSNNNTENYVAYCWAEIAGYSKFGSYAGNSSTDGPFIYLGFRPKFVIFKDYSNAHSWIMVDSSRNTYNVAGDYLRAESSAVENATYSVANNTAVDFLSNGFKLRNAAVNSGENNGSSNYLYMAWAENPFKNSNAR